MTVEQAAEKLEIPAKAVRAMMKRGTLPIGIVEKNGSRSVFYIFPKWVDLFLAGTPVILEKGGKANEKTETTNGNSHSERSDSIVDWIGAGNIPGKHRY